MTREEQQRQAEETHASQLGRLTKEMMHHIGQINAIGMAELYEIVFCKTWNHRINDTRKLRDLVEELRAEGEPICSSSAAQGGGYYVPAAGSEFLDYLDSDEIRAFRILRRNRRMRKVSLREYWGQAMIRMEQYDAETQAR
jgi:hypothetical protein